MFNVTARVAAGAEFLDSRTPRWDRKVNPRTLNINGYTTCILAHVFGNYSAGARTLRLEVADVTRCGFFPSYRGLNPIALCTENFLLNRAWRKLLRQRRDAVLQEQSVPAAA